LDEIALAREPRCPAVSPPRRRRRAFTRRDQRRFGCGPRWI